MNLDFVMILGNGPSLVSELVTMQAENSYRIYIYSVGNVTSLLHD
jgi:hypothetical protein